MTSLQPSTKTFELVDTYKNTQASPLLEQPVDYARKLKVAVIGAGISGIATAYKLRTEIENIEVVIYEKNKDVGGTWFENRYPGVACDVPSHCYQYSFAENTQWSKFYVPGSEILAYLRNCAAEFEIRELVKFNHEVVKAQWSDEGGQWALTLKQGSNEVNDTADLVVSAMGFLNHWEFPQIEGLENFKGTLLHTASWTLEPANSEAWSERTVAVIGCGSSAMQVVPALQPYVKHLDNYVRGRTWVSRPFVAPILSRYADSETNNHVFTEEEKALYKNSPETYRAFRLEMEDTLNSVASIGHEGNRLQEVLRNVCEYKMRQKLASRPDIAEGLIPDFPLSCRRLTPDGGYLDALLAPNVDFMKTEIRRFTEHGIETVGGEHRRYDVVVCATGFDTSFIPRFPVLGCDGLNLQDLWADRPKTYLGLCQDGFPNWFQIAGPNSTINLGSFVIVIERQIDYVLSCVRKIQRQRIKSMSVKKEAVQDFQNYCDAYFPRTVFARKCRNWYKKGETDGRVIGLWPGSSLHQLRVLEQPRFEDFNYTYTDNDVSGSSLYWLGNGSTVAEEEGKPLTRAWYLNTPALGTYMP